MMEVVGAGIRWSWRMERSRNSSIKTKLNNQQVDEPRIRSMTVRCNGEAQHKATRTTFCTLSLLELRPEPLLHSSNQALPVAARHSRHAYIPLDISLFILVARCIHRCLLSTFQMLSVNQRSKPVAYSMSMLILFSYSSLELLIQI